MMMRKFKNMRKRKMLSVDPDEIFMDSHNLENFDVQQFEGRADGKLVSSILKQLLA